MQVPLAFTLAGTGQADHSVTPGFPATASFGTPSATVFTRIITSMAVGSSTEATVAASTVIAAVQSEPRAPPNSAAVLADSVVEVAVASMAEVEGGTAKPLGQQTSGR